MNGNIDAWSGKPFYQGAKVHRRQGQRCYHPYGWEFSKGDTYEAEVVGYVPPESKPKRKSKRNKRRKGNRR